MKYCVCISIQICGHIFWCDNLWCSISWESGVLTKATTIDTLPMSFVVISNKFGLVLPSVVIIFCLNFLKCLRPPPPVAFNHVCHNQFPHFKLFSDVGSCIVSQCLLEHIWILISKTGSMKAMAAWVSWFCWRPLHYWWISFPSTWTLPCPQFLCSIRHLVYSPLCVCLVTQHIKKKGLHSLTLCSSKSISSIFNSVLLFSFFRVDGQKRIELPCFVFSKGISHSAMLDAEQCQTWPV